ncbi:MAG: SPFH domain-containing protein [Caldilineaceae bacterium SB0664_bin_27]|uniref:SPFH domain-containing protein n=1 Tax=Caldilineaceae bacterium SB0664_bin_27 TaxID=2605260 RepID=A0A6B0YLY8_9CHLR|nr:SPFH domain-containing protein [Caldilineaceae bacterium SB0664_bin_27]
MSRTFSFHTAALIAIPFLLVPAAFWLGINIPDSISPERWRLGVIWSLRIIYVGGAFVGWLAGRPHWFHSWVGFAVYAAVATLLQFALSVMGWQSGVFAAVLEILFILFAFSPYFVNVVWAGWHSSNRLLAVYTVFPHAALIIPLALLVQGESVGSNWRFVLLSAAAAAVIALLFRLPSATRLFNDKSWPRATLLFGGVIFTNMLFLLSYGYVENLRGIMGMFTVLIPLVGLAWLILSGPLLLPPLVKWLIGILGFEKAFTSFTDGVARALPPSTGVTDRISDLPVLPQSEKGGHDSPKGEANMSEETVVAAAPERRQAVGADLERFYKLSIVVLGALAVLLVALYVGRAAVYKIHEFERGLHLRGGRFLGVQTPGWHVQVPLVDTVIIVKVIERLGYVERIPAMTSDNVTMDVSLQFTYRVTNPERFALAVDDPERIVFEFVQGRLRDVINTKTMTGVMNQRTEMNLEIMQELKEKEDQYGVEFMTVQIQSASPPAEVLSAIKDRMVAVQRQEQAEAEAAQQRTVADAQFYAAQKEAEAAAYRISTTAAAEAEQIQLTTEAQQLAVRAILSELEGKGALAEKYIDYLIAVELKENSKWILGTGAEPILELRPSAEE